MVWAIATVVVFGCDIWNLDVEQDFTALHMIPTGSKIMTSGLKKLKI